MKRSMILIDRLGPVTLLKLPGDSSDFNVFLTKTSFMFLLCINEMSCGREKIVLVSLSF